MKPKRTYTVMIIPHSEKEPLTIRIPLYLIQSFFVILLLSFFLFIIGVLQYAGLKKQVKQLKYNATQAETMKKEFADVSRDLIDLQNSLTQMEKVEEKIRVQAKLINEEISITNDIGMGGPKKAAATHSKSSVVTLSVEETKGKINNLLTQTPHQLNQMQQLLAKVEDKNEKLAAIPSIYPSIGRITSKFGYRTDPFTRRSSFHRGIDIANRSGTPVYATATGIVMQSKYNGGHGKQIVINHQNGIVSSYSHLRKYIVEPGEEVVKGQLIGYMGSTGRSTGPHLHYEITINGNSVNPVKYFPY
jgi:murein DD-endopeptidase MepM/ murein hydrolase activator NlpD